MADNEPPKERVLKGTPGAILEQAIEQFNKNFLSIDRTLAQFRDTIDRLIPIAEGAKSVAQDAQQRVTQLEDKVKTLRSQIDDLMEPEDDGA